MVVHDCKANGARSVNSIELMFCGVAFCIRLGCVAAGCSAGGFRRLYAGIHIKLDLVFKACLQVISI